MAHPPPQNKNEKSQKPAPHVRTLHDDVPTWCDCCSCEPEPRWQAIEDEDERHQNSAPFPTGDAKTAAENLG